MTNDLVVQNKMDLVGVANALPAVSDRTKETYAIAMKSYLNFCERNEVKVELDSLLAWIRSADTPSTQALRTAASRKIFSVIYKGHPQLQELKDAIAEIKVVKRDHAITESKYLTKAEVEKLIANSPQRIAIMIKTLFMTGVRISELLNMRVDKCVPIRDGQVFEVKLIGKRNKENTVYLSEKMYDEIASVFDGKTFLFEHNGEQYNRKYISMEIARIGLVIGKDISAHSLRHSFAANLMEKGVSIDKISKSLAHASVSTTADFYLHKKASLEELGVIE